MQDIGATRPVITVAADPGTELTLEQASKAPSRADRRASLLQKIQDVEDSVLVSACHIVEAHLSFHEVSPYEENPPEEWVEQYGVKAAELRLKVAKTGHLPVKDLPSGVVTAQRVMLGMAKARGQAPAVLINQGGALPVRTMALPSPATKQHPGPEQYESREVEE